jgi:phage baseplate assembly protein gpV
MTLICRIELNKQKGIILSVENEQGQTVQTAELDGSSITLTCKGPSATSTIVQTPESVAIKCKAFSVEADTVEVKATASADHRCGNAFQVSGLDIALNADNSLKEKAMVMELESSVLELTAQSILTLKGQLTTVEGQATTMVKGGVVKLG